MENRAKIVGGALTTYKSSDVLVEKCKFSFNTAGTGGVSNAFQDSETLGCNHLGNFSVCEKFDDVKQNYTLTFNESEFWHNKAYESRVLYAQGSVIKLNVVKSVLCHNVAEHLGGGIFAIPKRASSISMQQTSLTTIPSIKAVCWY